MIKRLPFEKNVPIRSYQMFSYPLGIAYASEGDISKWLYKNFIQLKYDPNKELKFNFVYEWYGRWSFFKFQIVERDILEENHVDIYSFIKNNIDSGRYILAHINEKYHPDRAAFHKYDRIHDILILGYEGSSILTIGYTPNGYQESLLPWSVFTEMLWSIPSQYFFLIRMDKNLEDYFDIPWMCYDLNAYLHPEVCMTNPRVYSSVLPNMRYGVDIYDPLLSFIEECCMQRLPIDMRYIGVLVEHKHLMRDRISFLRQNNIIDDLSVEALLQKLERYCWSLQKNCTRYNARRDSDKFVDIRHDIEMINETEIPILEALLQQLEHVCDDKKL